MNKEVIVKLDSGQVAVKKMPLGKYAEVFSALKELPKTVGQVDFKELSNEEFIAQIPKILATALPEFAKVLSIATDVPEKQIMEMGLDEFTELFAAVVQVNNFEKVADNVKKIMARQPQTT